MFMFSKIETDFIELNYDGRVIFLPLNRIIAVEPDGADDVLVTFDASVVVDGAGNYVENQELRVRVTEPGLGERTMGRMRARVSSGPYAAVIVNEVS